LGRKERKASDKKAVIIRVQKEEGSLFTQTDEVYLIIRDILNAMTSQEMDMKAR
jgi:hypothetical protein